jgi:DNA-binding PadR family transcriptional regulator
MRGGEAEDQGWGPMGEEWAHRRGARGHGRGPRGPGGGRRGFGPGFGPGFGTFGMGGFGPWLAGGKFPRGPKVRRGDVRAAVLALLAEGPRNGYQIMQEIGERSGGLWHPSPGSVYPALQQLEDEGLIERDETVEGVRKPYVLTDEGREYVAAHPDEVEAPWEEVASSVGTDAIELRRLFGEVVMAAIQVARVGSEAQVGQAHQILTETRRKLYRILAADGDEQGE